MEARDRAILALKPTADHSALRGYFVKAHLGEAALVAAVSDIPLGVILDGEPTSGMDSIAVSGGNAGPVKVKLSASPGTVNLGTMLVVHSDGTAKADPGEGSRVRVAVALESGEADELIEATLILPQTLPADPDLENYYTKAEADAAFATAQQGTKADGALQADENLSDVDDAAVARGNLGAVEEAPEDGEMYVRKDGAWVQLPGE